MSNYSNSSDGLALLDAPENSNEEREKAEKTIRENLRSIARAKLISAVSGCGALTNSDIGSMMESYKETEISQFYKTDEEKREYLQNAIYNVIPQISADAKQQEREFVSKIQHAESNKWISSASAAKWISSRLTSSSMLWFQKKNFLENKFPQYYAKWERIHNNRESAKKKAKALGNTGENIPEIRALLSDSFLNKHVLEKEAIVNTALAAIAANGKRRDALYKKAKSTLESVPNTVLTPHKVSIWLRRIFESNADDQLTEDFLNGTLNQLIDEWTKAKKGFDYIKQRRAKTPIVPGFHFVNRNTFLGWDIEACSAYVQEADTRINIHEQTARGIFLDIRRELDMKDWMSAEHLIHTAKTMELSPKEQADLRSIQTYLDSQKLESAQTGNQQQESPDPQADMFAALAEVRKIDGGIYDLYTKAIAKGTGAFSALSSLMYNRCWVRQNAVIDESDEVQLREKAKEETPEIVQHGHGRGYENNYVPGYGSEAIRDQDKGEWSPQVLHLSNDPGAQDALLAKCESQQNNYSFKYWTTLIPEGLGYSQHQHIVSNLNWRIKAGIRAGGSMSANKARLGESTAKPAEPHYAIAT